MRIAKTFNDLPVGTPIEIEGHSKTYKGLVIERGCFPFSLSSYTWVKIRFASGSDLIYYEEDLEEEKITIVEEL